MQVNEDVASSAPAPENPKSVLRWIIGVSVVLGCLVIITYGMKFGWIASSKQEHWGQFGDYVGGILSSLFGFLTLLAVVVTVSMQFRQLDYTRRALIISSQELKLTREELEKAGAAQARIVAASLTQSKYAAMSARLNALAEAYRVTSDLVEQYMQSPSNPTMAEYWIKRKEEVAKDILKELESKVE